MRKSQKAHPERDREQHRRWNGENLEKSRGYSKAWRASHPDAARAQGARRRMSERLAFVEVVRKAEIYERDGGKCQMCRKALTLRTATLDHIVPLSLGGAHSRVNVRLTCRSCNSRRGAGRTPGQLNLV